MLSLRPAVIVLACLTLPACVTNPLSRTDAQSANPVSLSGYAGSAGQTVTIQAVDQNTGALVSRGTTMASLSGNTFTTKTGETYTLYPWSFNAGVMPANFWAPQTIVPDLATSQGHLEMVASGGGGTFDTFSVAAANSALASGLDPASAGYQYTDGKSTVLFDPNGVGSPPESAWTTVAGAILDSHSPYYSPVAFSVGYYSVEGGKKIYGLICAPTTGGPYPVVIYNHGGIGNVGGGNLTGNITLAGWTSQPFGNPDSLGQCVDWAKRGWIFAMSAYRGSTVTITSESPVFQPPIQQWASDGLNEFCLGEVTDVLALTDLLANHASAIGLGSPSQSVLIQPNGKIFMYGYSHGGCITYRAVEQGAPVTAFAVIEGFTDMSLSYLNGTSSGFTPAASAIGSGAYQPPVTALTVPYMPDASGIMGYNWRSAHYFASRGDFSIEKFKTMPILILHGDIDSEVVSGKTAFNPVFLDEPAEIAADLGTTNIFVGPMGTPAPSSEPCMGTPVGAPIPASETKPPASCPIAFTEMNTGDPCFSAPPGTQICKVVPIPLTPPPGQPQQVHYFVVYHAMDHTNGGLTFKETFNRFAEVYFFRQPGCDGLQINCADD
jgi:hypothetical protein